MDFTKTKKQETLCQEIYDFSCLNFSSNDIELYDNIGDSNNKKWREIWQKCADIGLLGLCVPKQYGGQGHDVLTSILMLESLGYGCKDNGFTMGINEQLWAVQETILAFGSEHQKNKYLPGLCNGSLIGSDAITEPTSGSDASNLKTTAVQSNGGYILNGEKTYIGMAPYCDVALVFASTNPEHKEWGLSAFLVDADSDGFIRGPEQEKMGLRSTPMGSIRFQDCWIPKESLLGTEGSGTSIFHHSMEWERSFIFSSHVGSMQRQLDDCVAYTEERMAFGKPIESFQSISNRLANMKLRLETSKLMLYKAAWLKDQGSSSAMESALTKLHISESFVESSMDAIRIHGGKGYLSDYGIEHHLRDSVGGVIYAGTSDIQRKIISRMLKDK